VVRSLFKRFFRRLRGRRLRGMWRRRGMASGTARLDLAQPL